MDFAEVDDLPLAVGRVEIDVADVDVSRRRFDFLALGGLAWPNVREEKRRGAPRVCTLARTSPIWIFTWSMMRSVKPGAAWFV